MCFGGNAVVRKDGSEEIALKLNLKIYIEVIRFCVCVCVCVCVEWMVETGVGGKEYYPSSKALTKRRQMI